MSGRLKPPAAMPGPRQEVEPLLAENPDRFCMFPIKYHDVWEMYKKAEASFWTGKSPRSRHARPSRPRPPRILCYTSACRHCGVLFPCDSDEVQKITSAYLKAAPAVLLLKEEVSVCITTSSLALDTRFVYMQLRRWTSVVMLRTGRSSLRTRSISLATSWPSLPRVTALSWRI